MTRRSSAASASYDLYGSLVRSEIDLGFSAVHDDDSRLVDVRLLVGVCREVPEAVPAGNVVAERFDGPGQRFYTAAESEGGYCLRFHRCFDFWVSGGGRLVHVDWDPSVDLPLAAVYFSGTVMAFLLGLAGRLTLHASAVAPVPVPSVGRSVIAILGDSGAGKTTLAALCAAAGAAFVTDDLLLVDLGGPEPIVVGAANELRLRPEAGWVLEQFPVAPRVRRTPDGRLAIQPSPDHGDAGAGRLRALLVPVLARDEETVELTRVSPVDALFLLARAPRLAGWTDETVLSRQFDAMANLAARVPCFTAKIPWAPQTRRRVGETLLRLVGEATR